MNIIASILELVKIFSEVIVASKCGPLARIEKQGMSQKLDLMKSFCKTRGNRCISGPHLKIKNQIKAYQNYEPSEKIF